MTKEADRIFDYSQLIEEVEGRLEQERYQLLLDGDEYSEEVEFLEEVKGALRRLQALLDWGLMADKEGRTCLDAGKDLLD